MQHGASSARHHVNGQCKILSLYHDKAVSVKEDKKVIKTEDMARAMIGKSLWAGVMASTNYRHSMPP